MVKHRMKIVLEEGAVDFWGWCICTAVPVGIVLGVIAGEVFCK